MTDAIAQPESSVAPLSQGQRVVDTFIAPSKTFTDILRSSSWWFPWLIAVVLSVVVGLAIQQKVGWDKVYENVMRQASVAQQQRLEQAPPDRQESIRKFTIATMRIGSFAAPFIGLIVTVVIAAVLLATLNFGFGARAKFGQLFAVWYYASLPMAIKWLLVVVTLYAGADPDSFNIKNPVGTNLGYYLPTDMSKGIISLATSIDIFTIWTLVLLTIGCSIIGKVSRGKAAGAVWGWWIVLVLVGAGYAAIAG
ncbi:MAG TPA: YIP1 family protein [Acidobacteriaceae bacterium]|nr:YIP1 family protein [Acidobacteriaceae bacterium]